MEAPPRQRRSGARYGNAKSGGAGSTCGAEPAARVAAGLTSADPDAVVGAAVEAARLAGGGPFCVILDTPGA